MSDIYRPLFVLVEAVEAECRRLLDQPKPAPMMSLLRAIESTARRHFEDETIRIERAATSNDLHIGHRCKVCRASHWVVVSEHAAYDSHRQFDAIVSAIHRLMEWPCDVGLRESTPPQEPGR